MRVPCVTGLCHFSVRLRFLCPQRYVLDDSWEDETGYVRSKARKFKNKGMLHDAGLMPPGNSPLRPSLPLLYNLAGEPYVAWLGAATVEDFGPFSFMSSSAPCGMSTVDMLRGSCCLARNPCADGCLSSPARR